jgi:hypothetical protein
VKLHFKIAKANMMEDEFAIAVKERENIAGLVGNEHKSLFSKD